jgi:hypothetical protein
LFNSLFTRVNVITGFNESPLYFYLSELAQKLDRQGYSRDVISRHLCAGEKFGRLLTANRLTPLSAHRIHSSRNATTGSTRMARRAGMEQAARATRTIRDATPA